MLGGVTYYTIFVYYFCKILLRALRRSGNKDKMLGALKDLFRPEFLNRVDEVIAFNALTETELLQIVDLLLAKTQEALSNKEILMHIKRVEYLSLICLPIIIINHNKITAKNRYKSKFNNIDEIIIRYVLRCFNSVDNT